jgi:hypothetical protein
LAQEKLPLDRGRGVRNAFSELLLCDELLDGEE